MLFNSPVFLFLFLPVTLLVYYALGASAPRAWALRWLVVASLFFYGWWNPIYLLVIVVSTAVNYAFGLYVAGVRLPSVRRVGLALGIGANLAVLGYFKYANFFIANVGRPLGWDTVVDVALPLGISFFTFQQIAYLVDAYRGLTRELDFGNYALFVTFFPQLIAGPIVHHGEMLPQFRNEVRPRFTADRIAIGGTIFILGLFKKMMIADGIAVYATPVFAAADAGASVSFLEAWGGALAYTFQLYFDFSGYSDMAVGLGQLFGIRLPQNFRSPYRCASIIEFWNCWHVTLSRFLRDYLYIPLGGNRKGVSRRYLTLLMTMLLGGLWHGAGWNFVLWGGLHGAYLCINHGFRFLVAGRELDPPLRARPLARLLPWSLTFVAVVFAWVFFRATSLDGALALVRAMLGLDGIALPVAYAGALGGLADTLTGFGVRFDQETLPLFQGATQLAWLALLLGLVLFVPNVYELMERYQPALRDLARIHLGPVLPVRWSPHWAWAVVVAVLGVTCVIHIERVSEFLYFQF